MIRTTITPNFKPKGFNFILSPTWVDNKTNRKKYIAKDAKSYRASYLATFNDTEITWPILYDNLRGYKFFRYW